MAYDSTKLQKVSAGIGSGGVNLWIYANQADTLATVSGAGYFSDGIARGMKQFDVVMPIISGVLKAGTVTSVTATAATFAIGAIT